MSTPTRIVASLLASLAATAALAMQAPQEPKPAEAAPAQAAPAANGPVFVSLETSKGTIVLELDPAKAPISVENFMKYVKAGFYDSTAFHRIVPNFVVQGGGFDKELVQKPTNPPIKNEWTNGLKNAKGTISMARLPSPDTATSQFFLNLKDNPALDGANGPGYAVFGKIVVGMNVLETLGQIRTAPAEGTDQTGTKRMFSDVPTERVMIVKASEITPEAAAKMIEDAKAAAPAAPAAPVAPAAPAAPAAK
jgi:cyclophilin family peptidyl-prolyl cis-trans isomerase